MSALSDYYEALERLKKNKPINIAPGGKINKDTVALEAGRKRGSIKSSRDGYVALIEDIAAASVAAIPEDVQVKDKVACLKGELKQFKQRYIRSINREIVLKNRVRELEAMLGSSNVQQIS